MEAGHATAHGLLIGITAPRSRFWPRVPSGHPELRGIERLARCADSRRGAPTRRMGRVQRSPSLRRSPTGSAPLHPSDGLGCGHQPRARRQSKDEGRAAGAAPRSSLDSAREERIAHLAWCGRPDKHLLMEAVMPTRLTHLPDVGAGHISARVGSGHPSDPDIDMSGSKCFNRIGMESFTGSGHRPRVGRESYASRTYLNPRLGDTVPRLSLAAWYYRSPQLPHRRWRPLHACLRRTGHGSARAEVDTHGRRVAGPLAQLPSDLVPDRVSTLTVQRFSGSHARFDLRRTHPGIFRRGSNCTPFRRRIWTASRRSVTIKARSVSRGSVAKPRKSISSPISKYFSSQRHSARVSRCWSSPWWLRR